MNTIVENKSKLDELVQEGYKIIYPNSIDGLDFEVIIKEKHQFSDPTILTPIKESKNCKCFNFYEKLFKYKGFLFLIPYHFMNTSTREYSLRFDKGEASKEFNLEWIHIISDNNEQRNYTDFYEKINYVLYSPKKDRLVFYIDDNFKIVFSNSTSYVYRNNNNAEIKSITTVINYLFTHLNEFPSMTKDEFINHLNKRLDEDFKD